MHHESCRRLLGQIEQVAGSTEPSDRVIERQVERAANARVGSSDPGSVLVNEILVEESKLVASDWCVHRIGIARPRDANLRTLHAHDGRRNGVDVDAVVALISHVVVFQDEVGLQPNIDRVGSSRDQASRPALDL